MSINLVNNWELEEAVPCTLPPGCCVECGGEGQCPSADGTYAELCDICKGTGKQLEYDEVS